LFLNQTAIGFLKECRAWAMFISILGFLGAVLMMFFAVIMFFVGSKITPQYGFPGGLLGLIALATGVIMIIPPIYLFGFAQKAGIACRKNDSVSLQEAIKHLRTNFKIRGIYFIIMIAIYFIAIFVAIAVGVTSAF
jgi:hypothetical protein